MRALTTTLFPVLTLASHAIFAHHSRSNFELDATIEFEGAITEFSWRNPHAYATLLTTNESGEQEEWLLELNSIFVLTRMGWNEDSLEVGDTVRVIGNRELDYEKRFLYSNVFELEDGTRLVSDPISGIAAAGGFQPRRPLLGSGPGGGAVADSTYGTWTTNMFGGGGGMGFGAPGGPAPAELLSGAIFGPSDLPVTAAGQAAVDAFDEADNPEFACIPATAPTLVTRGNMRIERDGDRVRFTHELMDAERIVYLDDSGDRAPALHGVSVGRFENDTLVVESTSFTANPWGNGRGVPSGDQKRVVERYSLVNGGRGLRFEYTHEDPEFLSETVTGTREFTFSPNLEWVEYDCDPEASSRHLNIE